MRYFRGKILEAQKIRGSSQRFTPSRLLIDFVAQFPPEAAGAFGPQKNPEPPLFEFGSAPPLEIHSPKPPEIIQEFFAEGRFQPSVILFFQIDQSGPPGLPLAIATQLLPLLRAAGTFHAMLHEVARLTRQRQMLAFAQGGYFAEGTTSLANHTFAFL